jgi:hypothetical protein
VIVVVVKRRAHPLAFCTVARIAYMIIGHRRGGIQRACFVLYNCSLGFLVGCIALLGLPLKRGGFFLFLTLLLNVTIGKAIATSN